MVDVRPTERWAGEAVLSQPGADGTDLAAAVRLSAALLAPEEQSRIVLLTDGKETRGSLDAALRGLPDRVAVDWMTLPSASGGDAVVKSVRVPARLDEGQPYAVRVQVGSSVDGEATLRLYRDGQPVAARRVTLEADRDGVFSVEAVAPDAAGPMMYRAEIELAGDAMPENNRGSAVAMVRGRPRLLLVDRDPGSLGPLAAALNAASFAVRTTGVSGLPANAVDLARFDAVVLGDVAATLLSDRQLQALHDYVRHAGGGLAMLGGPDSFGPGGYWETPLEAALPLDMDVKDQRHVPSSGLVLAIDKSGSMAGRAGVSKIDVAKTAAVEVATKLTPRDRVGVIAFDAAAKWVVPLTPAGPDADVRGDIGTIRAGGGTDAYPAMQLAFDALRDAELRAKHVILLTDGQLQARSHEALARNMTAAGITVSTVAIGTDADLHTLEQIARAGGGRHYRALDMARLPRIFLREAFQVTRSWLVEEPFAPVRRQRHPALDGLPRDDLPPLSGYVAASEKPGAQHLLGTHLDDPLLSVWQYGLGRSVAFTSDAKGRWSGQWLGWDGYGPFWSGLLRWAARRSDEQRQLQLQVERDGNQLRIAADAYRDDGSFLNAGVLTTTVLLPGGGRAEATLEQVGPGRYTGEVDAVGAGAYFVSVQGGAAGQEVGATTATSVAYPPEFAVDREATTLEAFVEAGRVQPREDVAGLFGATGSPATQRVPLLSWLLGVAAIAFLTELAARKLRLPQGRPARKRATVQEIPRLVRLRDAQQQARSRGRERRLRARPDATSETRSDPARPSREPIGPVSAAASRGGGAKADPSPADPAAHAPPPTPATGSAAATAEREADQKPSDTSDERAETTSRLLAARRRRRR